MSDRYTYLRAASWLDDEVMELPMIGKALWCYIISGPSSNSAGFYKLPVKTIKTDLCGGTLDGTVLDGEEDLFNNVVLPILYGQTKLWKYDRTTSQVLIPKYLKHNKAVGPKQLTGLNRQIETLTKCPLHVCFLNSVLRYSGEEAIKYFNREILLYAHEQISAETEPRNVPLYHILHNILYPI